MTVIDERVLIAASVEYVWVYLTEPAHISKWNRGAKQLSMLTTRADGVGSRRRCVSTHGQSVVEEITAWLPPYGYEYQIIDGPYARFTGRLRLQAVPEGTQIQWLIDYDLRGVLARLRDRFRYRRRMNGQIRDSLRALRRLIEASGVRLDLAKQAKVVMQADPGVAARLARRSDPTRQSAPLTIVPEPVISVGDDDLPDMPPEPSVSLPTFIAGADADPTPSFVTVTPGSTETRAKTKPLTDNRSEPLVDDTKPRPPAGLREALTTVRPATRTTEMPTVVPGIAPTRPPVSPTTVSAALAAPRPVDPTTQTRAPLPVLPAREAIPPAPTLPPPTPEPSDWPAALPPPERAVRQEQYDTGEMSIWDVFGVDRPSERNKVNLDEMIASLQAPLPDNLPPLDVPPPAAERLNVAPIEPAATSTPPPPPLEPLLAMLGRAQPEAPEAREPLPLSKVSIRVRHMITPRHSKASVSVRRAR